MLVYAFYLASDKPLSHQPNIQFKQVASLLPDIWLTDMRDAKYYY